MRREEPENGGSRKLFATVRKSVPFKADATSERLGWVGLQAARYLTAPIASEIHPPAVTHHTLFLSVRPPEELDLEYEGVKRHVPPPAGAISAIPAGSPSRWRWTGRFGSLVIFLRPELVARVAAEAFDLDPARLTVPPLDGLDLPQLRNVMQVVDAELMADSVGGPLAAELLANLLAVHLIRHALAPRRTARSPDGLMPQRRLRAVVEYIESHVNASPSLEQMAAIAQISPHHFARQFKAKTGLPPHQFVIVRRVERAKELLRGSCELSLAQVAFRAGFVCQSHLNKHFKRLVGITPKQFRQS